MSLHLTPLTSGIEPQFWAIVERDTCDYYFFIYDWILQKSKTEIFLAKKGDVVEGLIVIYDGTIAQLRGNQRGCGFMLKAFVAQAERRCRCPWTVGICLIRAVSLGADGCGYLL
jgi:hypothetical protein